MPWPPLKEEKSINKAPKLLLQGAKIIDSCLFNPTVEGAWMDQKTQILLGPLKKQLRSATVCQANKVRPSLAFTDFVGQYFKI